MKSILNEREIPYEMLEGVAFANPHLEHIENTGIILQKNINKDIVPIISGGGSGHEPAHFGFVGEGMLTASISGSLFTPPNYKEILYTIEKLNNGKGVFVVIKNFEADMEQFYKAIQEARKKGIAVKYVVTHDDISVDTYNFQKRHRGVAGTILVHKILGAAAKKGASLEELEELGVHLTSSINTLGVALNSAKIPGYEQYSFELAEDELSFGIGIHGEEGYRKEKFGFSERLAIELVNKIKSMTRWKEEDEYIILINGLGSMPLMDQYIFANDIKRLMMLENIKVAFCKVGNFMTSYNMNGISLTMCELKNKDWLKYLAEKTEAFAW